MPPERAQRLGEILAQPPARRVRVGDFVLASLRASAPQHASAQKAQDRLRKGSKGPWHADGCERPLVHRFHETNHLRGIHAVDHGLYPGF
jgi:hypothetical protein